MAGKVAASELRERFLPRQQRYARRALLQQRVGELPASAGSAANHAIELSLHHEMAEPVPVGVDAGPTQSCRELRPRQIPAALQRLFDGHAAARKNATVQLQFAVVVGHQRFEPGRRQIQQPTDVGRCDEVPCRTQDMRAQDRTVGERSLDRRVGEAGRALTEPPFRGAVVLGLHRTQPRHERARLAEPGCRQLLVAEAAANEIELRVGHEV